MHDCKNSSWRGVVCRTEARVQGQRGPLAVYRPCKLAVGISLSSVNLLR